MHLHAQDVDDDEKRPKGTAMPLVPKSDTGTRVRLFEHAGTPDGACGSKSHIKLCDFFQIDLPWGKQTHRLCELDPANQMAGLGFSDVAEEASDGLEWVESNWPLGGFMFMVGTTMSNVCTPKKNKEVYNLYSFLFKMIKHVSMIEHDKPGKTI